ncbi:Hypothetical predicted protein [Paramuricea clavata]|uniref:Uncharacterized protein n=1 Tax=Paramuricea clavata TaxID=317549 RepID=A0A7D9EJT6_PARCT|nr:Hypothetical predicted protein [Paramuricea clavata]
MPFYYACTLHTFLVHHVTSAWDFCENLLGRGNILRKALLYFSQDRVIFVIRVPHPGYFCRVHKKRGKALHIYPSWIYNSLRKGSAIL